MKNIYLIYGEDTFRSRQKVEAIRARYRDKFADLEIINLAGDSVDFQELESKLFSWIETHVAGYQGTITRDAAQQLALWFGPDTWKIHQEIAKLLTLNAAITPELVKKLTPPQTEGNIFELLDSLWSGNQQEAARKLTELVTSGQPLLQILSTISTAIRNLLLVKESIERSPSITSFQVARTLELHPYVVTKAFRSVRSIDRSELARKLELVGYIDQRIKTGRLEPGVALEILVARLVG
ncbi:hypothetical protein HYZ64_01865 [Candidatus Berkelbacteria bacterium]|nr:hypothetical protein [Candidatus Berkelbacteria bacterium]